MLDLGLADRIRRKGIVVHEVAGWTLRSAAGSYNPRGSLNHHTAGGAVGTVPSLATCIYGRPDLPGPLCEVLQSRELDKPDEAYVIAAGRANHAGAGGWRGLSGNGSVSGLEVEHVGTGPVSNLRKEISARIQAAMLEAPGSSRDAAFCCQHFEWTPRKIDFFDLAPWTVTTFRARVAYWIGRDFVQPTPHPIEDDEPMTIIRRRSDMHAMVAYGGKLMSLTGEANVTSANTAGIPIWVVDDTTWNRLVSTYGPIH